MRWPSCCSQVPLQCISGVVDNNLECCPNGMVDTNGTCHEGPGSLDRRGAFCPGSVLDVCGVCNGASKVRPIPETARAQLSRLAS
jgi:hypothetical protein